VCETENKIKLLVCFLLKFSRRTQHYSCLPHLPIKNTFTNTTADIQAFYKIHHFQDVTNLSATICHTNHINTPTDRMVKFPTYILLSSEKRVSGIKISEWLVLMMNRTGSSEMLLQFYQIMWHHRPQDTILILLWTLNGAPCSKTSRSSLFPCNLCNKTN
jgi:hypothetical protein